MPTLTKPSTWQPRPWPQSKDYNAVAERFPPHVMKDIIALLLGKKSVDPTLRMQYENRVILAALDAKTCAYMEGRATPAQRRVALGNIQRAAKTLLNSLQTLDDDSALDLHRSLAKVKPQLPADKINHIDKYSYPYLQQVYSDISELACCAEDAISTATDKKEGNRRADKKLWLAQNLLAVWTHAGKKPTIITKDGQPKYGDFLDFVTAVSNQLGWRSMEDATRRAIADSKQAATRKG